jgi:predicted HNH restriction endonuclease
MYTDAEPPSTKAYKHALESLGEKLTETGRKIFAIHFSLPARAMTSQRLRDELGYTAIAASNGVYGRLGHLIADAVGFDPQSTRKERRGWWRSMSTGDDSGENFVWFMRPQLAAALVSLGLVDPFTDGTKDLIDPDVSDGITAVEGRLRLRSHLARERSRALTAAKRASVIDRRCEVCGFSAFDTYGIDYCEVHHLIPLARLTGATPTKLDDLAIVCANCHRIIHLFDPPLTIEQLQKMLHFPQDEYIIHQTKS